MPEHAHIDVAAIDASDAEPIDEFGWRFRFECLQHADPCAELQLAPVQAAQGCFDAYPHRLFQRVRLVIKTRSQSRAQLIHGPDEAP